MIVLFPVESGDQAQHFQLTAAWFSPYSDFITPYTGTTAWGQTDHIGGVFPADTRYIVISWTFTNHIYMISFF